MTEDQKSLAMFGAGLMGAILAARIGYNLFGLGGGIAGFILGFAAVLLAIFLVLALFEFVGDLLAALWSRLGTKVQDYLIMAFFGSIVLAVLGLIYMFWNVR